MHRRHVPTSPLDIEGSNDRRKTVEQGKPRRPRLACSPFQKPILCAIIAALLGSLSFILFLLQRWLPTSSVDSSGFELHSATKPDDSSLPMPPYPYAYGNFISWFRKINWGRVRGIAMQPRLSWFDVDRAVKEHPDWFQQKPIGLAVDVAKSVNRYLFMNDAVLHGYNGTQAPIAAHLFILHKLRFEATKPRATLLDAGCGSGLLLLEWELIGSHGGEHAARTRIIGIDSDPDAVIAARRNLANPFAATEGEIASVRKSRLVRGSLGPEVYEGNALSPNFVEMGVDLGAVDAINVGAAVERVSDLLKLAQLLKPGGMMVAPICIGADGPNSMKDAKARAFEAEMDDPDETGRINHQVLCNAKLTVFQRSRFRESELERDPRSLQVDVRLPVLQRAIHIPAEEMIDEDPVKHDEP